MFVLVDDDTCADIAYDPTHENEAMQQRDEDSIVVVNIPCSTPWCRGIVAEKSFIDILRVYADPGTQNIDTCIDEINSTENISRRFLNS